MDALPMFPLGSVLLPGAVLPLHIFEPRYRVLVHDCLRADGTFGVVLIERGSEVGGGEVRLPVGTVARIVEAAELTDGRWAVVSVGTERLRVDAWLDDDPYPRAQVEPWPDPTPSADARPALDGVVATLRRVLGRSAEMGDSVATATATSDLAGDVSLACFQACSLAPLGPADHYALLTASGVDERITLLARLLADIEVDLDRRIALEGPGS